jgi:hypothetical protein
MVAGNVFYLLLSYGDAFGKELLKKFEDRPLISVAMADAQFLELSY